MLAARGLGTLWAVRARFAATVVALVLFVLPSSARAEAAPRAGGHPTLTQIGVVLFLGSYAWSAGTGLVYREDGPTYPGKMMSSMFIPVVGPLISLHGRDFNHESTLTGRLVHATTSTSDCASVCVGALPILPFYLVEEALIYGAALGQATGLVLTVIGLATETAKVPPATAAPARAKLTVSPSSPGAAVGLSVGLVGF